MEARHVNSLTLSHLSNLVLMMHYEVSKLKPDIESLFFFFFTENPDSVVQSYFSKFEEQWFSYCNEELEKINTFFAGTFQFSATVEVSLIL